MQDTTINCAAGGPLVRELKLLEKYLPFRTKLGPQNSRIAGDSN